MKTQYCIIGGGICGLVAAYQLQKSGKQVLLLEKGNTIGGVMQTIEHKEFTHDQGANSFAITPEIEALIKDLGLENSLLQAQKVAANRYIYRKGELIEVQQKPSAILRSPLLSWGAKLRIFRELLLHRSRSKDDESVYDFFKRHFGKEITEGVIAPVMGGIYAGDIQKLGIRYTMPSVVEMEKKTPSLLKGMAKAAQKAKKEGNIPSRQIVSFKGGMRVLMETLGSKVEKVLNNCEVLDIQRKGGVQEGFRLQTSLGEIEAQRVVVATPSYAFPLFLANLSPEIARLGSEIFYTAVTLLHLSYRDSDIQKPLQGFGFLVPPKENTPLLGAICNSAVFETKAPEGYQTFTVFVGGANYQQGLHQNLAQTIQEAQQDFEKTLGITGESVEHHTTFWAKAIPQPYIGHQRFLDAFDSFEAKNPDISLFGNYRFGVSVGDCIKKSLEKALKV